MEEIPQKFFDFTQPCPEEVKDCGIIREQYTAELDHLRSQGACGGCAERGLRNKYIAIILNNIFPQQ